MSSTTNLDPTPAQEEFRDFLAKNTHDDGSEVHPEDREDARREAEHSEDDDEEDRYRQNQIDAAMRMPALRGPAANAGPLKLPPASFDSGRSTGVKGVIADARAYEEHRQSKWRNRVRAARRSVFGLGEVSKAQLSSSHSSDVSEDDIEIDEEEEEFLQQWREARRLELEKEVRNGIYNRRTSPSARIFGRMDTVDALGYLDAIEKVNREAVVVVFVTDETSDVSKMVEMAMQPLVAEHPTVHFVKIHYEDIEFEPAGVPAVLAYRNQGEDLFANLTGLIDLIPDDDELDTPALRRVFIKNGII